MPTQASLAQALGELGPITTGQLSLLQDYLDVGRIGDAGKKLLKSRIMQVGLCVCWNSNVCVVCVCVVCGAQGVGGVSELAGGSV